MLMVSYGKPYPVAFSIFKAIVPAFIMRNTSEYPDTQVHPALNLLCRYAPKQRTRATQYEVQLLGQCPSITMFAPTGYFC